MSLMMKTFQPSQSAKIQVIIKFLIAHSIHSSHLWRCHSLTGRLGDRDIHNNSLNHAKKANWQLKIRSRSFSFIALDNVLIQLLGCWSPLNSSDGPPTFDVSCAFNIRKGPDCASAIKALLSPFWNKDGKWHCSTRDWPPVIPCRVEDYRGCEERLKAMCKLGLNECSSVLSGNMESDFTISTLSPSLLTSKTENSLFWQLFCHHTNPLSLFICHCN